jgi:cation transport regulator ChaB
MADRGKIAYEAYAAKIEEETAWEDLPGVAQEAWNAAAEAVLDAEDEADDDDDETAAEDVTGSPV